MKYSIAIAIRDEQDLASGHKRKKQGDIIAVKPAGHQWGDKEVKEYLILEVDMPTTNAETLIAQGDNGEKRKFKIPFSKLALSQEDLAKVEDPNIEFQPFIKTVLNGSNLVYNKTISKVLDLTKL